MSLPPLWKHQENAVQKSFSTSHLGLFFEIGTGKSRTAIDILRYKCAGHERLLRTLILSPKITLVNWQREIAKYSKIHPRDVLVLEGSGAKRKKKLLEAITDGYTLTKPKIIITNYETLQMEDVYNILTDWKPELMIADEAHRIKSHRSIRAKLAIQLADKALYKYVLTGTPILNTPADIFNIFRFMDGGQTFGTNYWKFQGVWFEDVNAQWAGKPGYFPKYMPRPETYEQFNELIYRKALRALKKDCLDLPPFVRKEVHVELGPEQRRLYDEMKNEYIAYIDDVKKTETPRVVVAQMAVTKALRLVQIATGYAKDEDGAIHVIEKNPRLEALKELLSDYAEHHKIIVWSVFHENYSQIAKVCADLGLEFTELHGKIHQRDRDSNIDRFNNDPKCRVLIANQAAAGIGINLISSDLSIYYSKNFSLEQDLQSEGRNYRGGSEIHKSVTRIDIVATNTMDDVISTTLAGKQDVATKILDLKREDF